MTITKDRLEKLSRWRFYDDARARLGSEGEDCVVALLNDVRRFFMKISPEQIPGGVVMVRGLRDASIEALFDESAGERHAEIQWELLPTLVDRIGATGAVLVRVVSDDIFDVVILQSENLPDPANFHPNSVTFINRSESDYIYIGEETRGKLPRLAPGTASMFFDATIRSLDEALVAYRLYAGQLKCRMLQAVWDQGVDGPRLVFHNKPEKVMRKSLAQFLDFRLGLNARVREEQNTDDSKPVDIVVNWSDSSNRCLIEVKWMGWSLTSTSDDQGNPRFTKYTDARAISGYAQLADYLDRERTSDPQAVLSGYLIVFDGRRRGLSSPVVLLTQEQAEHYRNLEVMYPRDYASERKDMHIPMRYFLEPRAAHFAAK